MMHILEQSQPVQRQKQQNLQPIQEEYGLTFDDIKRGKITYLAGEKLLFWFEN